MASMDAIDALMLLLSLLSTLRFVLSREKGAYSQSNLYILADFMLVFSFFCKTILTQQKKPKYVMTNKSSKVFSVTGEQVSQVNSANSVYTLIGNGELVRSNAKQQHRVNIFFDFPFRLFHSH